VEAPPIQFLTPSTPAEWDATRLIFREYARSLGVDLCFQNFEAELDGLPGDYAEPRGALLLALVNGRVLLDTLDDMEAARALYEDLGFEDIPPYYHSPIVGAHYLKADL
jgi:putative acetyltransferase